MQRPFPGDYNPYFEKYINLVADAGGAALLLQQNKDGIVAFFNAIGANQHDFAYAPGKWTIKNVLMHLIDTERVMAYRMLAAARGDKATVLPPMDEDLYAANVDAGFRSMDSLLVEFSVVREATILLVAHLSEEQLKSVGNVAGHPITPLALVYIIAGHGLHHVSVIRERYL